jgi:hypothetical protein
LVNLNQPKYIREVILYGLNKGWTGKNSIEILNGLSFLSELGYKIDTLLPKKKGNP